MNLISELKSTVLTEFYPKYMLYIPSISAEDEKVMETFEPFFVKISTGLYYTFSRYTTYNLCWYLSRDLKHDKYVLSEISPVNFLWNLRVN